MMSTSPRILAVASAGGHFQQLMALKPGAAEGASVTYMTTLPGLAAQFGAAPQITVPDCNADTWLRALWAVLVIGWHMLRLRPHGVITTGALPGLIAVAWGRVIFARTLWIDSVANAEALSASGKLARRLAHDTLSQWPEVAAQTGTAYKGSIL